MYIKGTSALLYYFQIETELVIKCGLKALHGIVRFLFLSSISSPKLSRPWRNSVNSCLHSLFLFSRHRCVKSASNLGAFTGEKRTMQGGKIVSLSCVFL